MSSRAASSSAKYTPAQRSRCTGTVSQQLDSKAYSEGYRRDQKTGLFSDPPLRKKSASGCFLVRPKVSVSDSRFGAVLPAKSRLLHIQRQLASLLFCEAIGGLTSMTAEPGLERRAEFRVRMWRATATELPTLMPLRVTSHLLRPMILTVIEQQQRPISCGIAALRTQQCARCPQAVAGLVYPPQHARDVICSATLQRLQVKPLRLRVCASVISSLYICPALPQCLMLGAAQANLGRLPRC